MVHSFSWNEIQIISYVEYYSYDWFICPQIDTLIVETICDRGTVC